MTVSQSQSPPRLSSLHIPPIPPTHSYLQYPMLSLQPHPCRSHGLVEMGLATTSYPSVLLLSLRSGPASGHLICPRMSVGCSSTSVLRTHSSRGEQSRDSFTAHHTRSSQKTEDLVGTAVLLSRGTRSLAWQGKSQVPLR